MSDKTIKTAANIVLALAGVAILALILKYFEIEPSRIFWEVAAAVIAAEAVVLAVAALLLARFLAGIRRPQVRVVPLYGFRLSKTENGHPRGTLRLGVRNRGTRTLNRFRWHLFIPEGLRPEITMRDGDRTINIGTRNVGGYEYASGYVEGEPLLPKSTKELPLSIRLESSQGGVDSWTLRYAVSTEYGQFPVEAEQHESLDASVIPDCAPLVLQVE